MDITSADGKVVATVSAIENGKLDGVWLRLSGDAQPTLAFYSDPAQGQVLAMYANKDASVPLIAIGVQDGKLRLQAASSNAQNAKIISLDFFDAIQALDILKNLTSHKE